MRLKLLREVWDDRERGADRDPKARIFKDKYHRALAFCSKDELVDLVCDLCQNDYTEGVNFDLDDRVQHRLSSILTARYCNRHPEEI